MRTRVYRRDVRNKAIARKKAICKHVLNWSDWYKYDGQYSKGKVHCSCWMCAYNKRYNVPKVSDLRNAEREKDFL